MHTEKDRPARAAGPAVSGAGRDVDDRAILEPLSALQRAALEYPALYPFGTDLFTFLDAESEKSAPFEARLRSAWRYIVRRVQRFARTLKPREAAILDVEDVVHSVAARLVEKDHLWDANRGRYSTFVEAVMVSVLTNCHEKARAVSGPANSYSRMKKYKERQQQGTMTRSMAATMKSIEQVMGDFDSWDDATLVRRADDDVDVRLILAAIKSLDDPIKTWVFVHKNGLLGQAQLTLRAMAARLEITVEDVKDLWKEADAIVKSYLVDHRADVRPWEVSG